MVDSSAPGGLGTAGVELWDGVCDGRQLSAAFRALLLNACRIADRLDAIEKQIPAGSDDLTVTNEQGTTTVHPLVSEQRQQLAQLSQILVRLGFKELPKIKGVEQKSVADQLAAKREARRASGE